MDRDEIWHRGGPQGEGSWGFQPGTPPPPGTGCVKGVWGASGASTVHFGENFIKQKLQDTPNLVWAGHLFWAPNPEGPRPPVLLEPWSLTMKGSS